MTPRACGSCALCCKLLDIPELDKPASVMCGKFAKGVGCTIHADRPGGCRHFQCFWTVTPEMPEEWRPNQIGFFIWTDAPDRLIIEVDPVRPDAWRRAPYEAKIRSWPLYTKAQVREVLVRIGQRMIVVFANGEIDLGPQQKDRNIESGYRMENGRLTPYAFYYDPATRPAG